MLWSLILVALAISLLQLGRLSRRIGTITHARPFYLAFYVAAVLLVTAGAGHALLEYQRLAQMSNIVQNSVQVILVDGLAAMGITIALAGAWYYWSWLLAERD